MNRNDISDKRIPWVDVLKFLGIFAIYLGHFGEESGKLYPFVYTYHVPLFFFVSGFFADAKKGEKLFSFIVKKFRILMVPYFAFVALSVLIHLLQYDLMADQMLFEIRRYIFAVRNTLLHPSLWFFSCLFNNTKYSLAFGVGVPVLFFMLNILGGIKDEYSWITSLSLYKLFSASEILSGSTNAVGICAVFAVISLCLFGGGIYVFQKKNLPL